MNKCLSGKIRCMKIEHKYQIQRILLLTEEQRTFQKYSSGKKYRICMEYYNSLYIYTANNTELFGQYVVQE